MGRGHWGRRGEGETPVGETPTCSHNTTPSRAPGAICSIWSFLLRTKPQPRAEGQMEHGAFEISLSPSVANVVCLELLRIIYIWTFRCSTQLVLFGTILWFLCLVAGERGGRFWNTLRTQVELPENPPAPLLSLPLDLCPLARNVQFTVGRL